MDRFRSKLIRTALPITGQSLLQSSFSLIDQLMVGQLGTVSVAAVGIAGKFSSFYTVLLAALVSAYGIMLSQYAGASDGEGEAHSLRLALLFSLLLTLLFLIPSLIFPEALMRLYINDEETVREASRYLFIVSLGFPAQALTLIFSTILRSHERASLPMYASLASALVNSSLNYLFIFTLERGAAGAGEATVISQYAAVVLVFIPSLKLMKMAESKKGGDYIKAFCRIFLPIVFCEFFWGLGENVYASVYGHLGRESAAAYSLTGPVQSLMIGALTGLSQASGILIGKDLGRKDYDASYSHSRTIVRYGVLFSILLSFILIFVRKSYLSLYSVESTVSSLASALLLVYAFYAPVKVSNMIIGGGIIRAGGRTDLSMYVDFIGTWCIGVPLALLTGRVFHLPVYLVYAALSLEEVVRLSIVSRIWVKKKWMESITN